MSGSADDAPSVRQDVEQAETGDAAAARRVAERERRAPTTAEAAEQEIAEAPAGRGLSR